MKSSHQLWFALGGLAIAAVLAITEPECSNLTLVDLERFANGETVEYKPCNPYRIPVIALTMTALGLGACWYIDQSQQQSPPALAPQRSEQPPPGTSLRQAVADAIRTHPEYHWLLKLLECHTVLIVGPQGSGKTRFAVALAYLRMIIRHHAIRDTNAPDPQSGRRSSGLKKSDRGDQSLETIAAQMADYLEQLKTKQQKAAPLTEILNGVTMCSDSGPDSNLNRNSDSASNSDRNGGANRALDKEPDKGPGKKIKRADELFTSITTESKKAREHHILVTHDHSQALIGEDYTKTNLQSLKDDYIVLNLHAARTPTGVPAPNHQATVVGVDFDQAGQPSQAIVSYPDWFNPEILGEVLLALPASFHLEARSSYCKARRRHPKAFANPAFSEDFDDLEKNWELVDIPELTSVFSAKPPEKPITPVDAIDLLLSNTTPQKLIVEYWGVTGGRAYREVSELLKNAISEYASLEQWRQLKATHSKFFGA
ncbi:MAG: hypothetical protein AAF152_09370 [Cyanobacteria bacterium P01_A01_bin.114]